MKVNRKKFLYIIDKITEHYEIKFISKYEQHLARKLKQS
jgi:hypothetical protein